MYPILFSIGPFHMYSFSLLLVLAWCVFSFIFWQILRAEAVGEEHIFDLMFYASLVALVSSRIGFVIFHWDLFSDNYLKIVALWVQPGLSLYGGLVGAMVTLVLLCRSYKVRLGYVVDALGLSLPGAFMIGAIATQLDGSEVGKLANTPWSVRYVGHVGLRHPVGLYACLVLLCISVIVWLIYRRAKQDKWSFGIVGIWFFLLWSVTVFGLEFFKDNGVYWKSLSANQWVLIGIASQALGAFYVRGGGREAIRPLVSKVRTFFANAHQLLYAKFSKRHS